MKRMWVGTLVMLMVSTLYAQDLGQPRPLELQRATKKMASQDLDSESSPPVTKADLRIVQRARKILDSPAKWNRADTRDCPAEAKTFSLYCALEKATVEVTGKFEHRGAAMQEARFVIDEVMAKGNHYEHRLMGYNNDPKTTFADIQKFFRILEERIVKRFAEEARPKAGPGESTWMHLPSRCCQATRSPREKAFFLLQRSAKNQVPRSERRQTR